MREISDRKKTRNITFRLTDDEYTQVQKAAWAAGDNPNNWCRKRAIEDSREEYGFTRNERLIYKEIALLRFLIGHGFKLLFSDNQETASGWKKLTTQADQRSEEIVKELLSRRR